MMEEEKIPFLPKTFPTTVDLYINALDEKSLTEERVSHLESVLKTVADLLERDNSPENVAKAIVFIRKQLPQEEENQ